MKYRLAIGQNRFEVEVLELRGENATVSVNGVAYQVRFEKNDALPPQSAAGFPAPTAAPPAPKPAPALPRPASAPAAVAGKPFPAPAAPAVSNKPAAPSVGPAGGTPVPAPIPGLVLEILAGVGEQVEAGQAVVIMEAMKMENRLNSPVTGTVKEIRVQKGAQVATGDVLLVIASV